ncbi:MAG: flagellar basal body P-ring protein FlgI [Tepidisphaeraceae bacterium]
MTKWPIILLATLGLAVPARAVKVADITRIGGQRSNVLTGLGLIYGLKGSGDGGDFLPAIKPLASMLGKFSDPATVLDLSNVSNVALVSLTATVPSNGVRDGDRIDVYVTSLGAATSLRGGRLFVTPMQGPLAASGIFALSEGPVVLEDPSTPTVGVVKGGCVMEADLPAHYIDNGHFTLVLEDPAASWTMASTIAKIINDGLSDDGQLLATAIDPKNIVVVIPPAERARPDGFISRVQLLPVTLLPSEARVQINDRTGTIVMTGDVEISPVVISHKGLTISTILPPTVPTPRNPVIEEQNAIALDTTNQGGAKLQELLSALDAIKVPAEDRIAIIKELYKTGKLHAKLSIE